MRERTIGGGAFTKRFLTESGLKVNINILASRNNKLRELIKIIF